MWDQLGPYNQPGTSIRPLNDCRSQKKSSEGYIFLLSRIFGVFPLDKNLKCPLGLVFYTFCLRVLYSLVGVASIYQAYLFEKMQRSDVEVASYAVTYFSEAISMCVLLVHDLIILKDHKAIRNSLSSLKNWDRQNIVLLRPLMLGISLIAVKCFFIVGSFYRIGKDYKMYEEFPFLLTHIQSYLIVLQFCALLSVGQAGLITAVHQREFKMSDCLSHFEHVQNLKALNHTYGWQLLLTTFQIFSHSLISLFWIVIEIDTVTVDNEQYIFIICNALEVLYRMYELSLVIHWSTETTALVEKFNSKLTSSLRGVDYTDTKVDLHFYASMRNSVVFTAKGFLQLNQPLATSIVTAAITYLVILLQFAKK